ncbi:MAG: hypothetical protein FVQ78_08265 [Solirubrobacterales bacterium]|nr:hypothetical protein [Solirubrobacterales bacterium]
MHKAVRNVTRLFERIQDYEKRVLKRRCRLGCDDFEALIAALACWSGSSLPSPPTSPRRCCSPWSARTAPSRSSDQAQRRGGILG